MQIKPITIKSATSILLCCCLMGVGCSKKEPENSQKVMSAPSKRYSSSEIKVELSPDVKNKWKNVTILVLDKSNFLTSECIVPIGGSFELADPSIRIEAPIFIPDFTMRNGKITSLSNKLNNPAVKIIAYQKDTQIFNSWVYGRYQETDLHPRFRFMLADVGKK